jgi:hypothetical protein
MSKYDLEHTLFGERIGPVTPAQMFNLGSSSFKFGGDK